MKITKAHLNKALRFGREEVKKRLRKEGLKIAQFPATEIRKAAAEFVVTNPRYLNKALTTEDQNAPKRTGQDRL